mmetsp:Transcript_4390/g.7432  ORF Transcript_4390/g.7432 Transcript_4390/m.7432 type:complete len:284 (-) Transcript_4390:21-872(-)
MAATEVGEHVAPHEVLDSEDIAEDLVGVGTGDTVHAVEAHGEVLPVDELLDLAKVEQLLHKLHVELGVVYHVHRVLVQRAFHSGEDGLAHGAGVYGLVALKQGILGDLEGLRKYFLGHVLEGRSSILPVELDSEVLVGASGVVAGREDDASEAVAGVEASVVLVELSDEGGDGGGGEEAVLPYDNFLDAIGHGDLDDGLGGDVIVEPAVSRHYQSLSLVLGLGEGVEDGLDEVLEVVRLLEDLDLLPEATGAWLLVLVRRGDLDGLGLNRGLHEYSIGLFQCI